MENIWGFEFAKVSSAAELQDIYTLRYKVYVDEWGFEHPDDHPEGIETDAFDKYSVHFMASRYGQLLGTIRLILHSPEGFPIEKHCTITADCSAIGPERIAEISRLAISKEYRKRAVDRLLYSASPGEGQDVSQEDVPNSRRKRQEIIIGLFKAMYAESKRLGLTHWYAVMAKALHVLLQRIGFDFVPIGPDVEYHGLRAPYILCIEDVEKRLSMNNPELYKEFVEAAGCGV